MDDFPVDALKMPEYDSSDPEQVLAVEQAVELRCRQEKETVRRILTTYEGRAFIWMLMQTAGADQGVFSGEAPMTMSRLEGRREIGMWGRDWVFTAAPEQYNILRQEAIQREQHYAAVVGLGGDIVKDE